MLKTSNLLKSLERKLHIQLIKFNGTNKERKEIRHTLRKINQERYNLKG